MILNFLNFPSFLNLNYELEHFIGVISLFSLAHLLHFSHLSLKILRNWKMSKPTNGKDL